MSTKNKRLTKAKTVRHNRWVDSELTGLTEDELAERRGERLRSMRLRLGKSQEEMSIELGDYTQGLWNKLEHGHCPGGPVLAAIELICLHYEPKRRPLTATDFYPVKIKPSKD